jgi:subtilase family serine protease
VEWASAGPPSATIELASCADTTNFGPLTALQNLISASGTPPAIMSLSYGGSETLNGAVFNAYTSSLYQQAVTEGVSIFVSSGDQAAAVSDGGATTATHGINVNALASTPYNVAVGGTDFGDTFAMTNATYWSATNSASFGSALSYIPEIPWNDSCASVLFATKFGTGTTYGTNGFCNSPAGSGFILVAGGSGGPSGCATGAPSTGGVVSGTCAGNPKPVWQAVFGNPNDGVRDTPDVSLFAADGSWGHYYVACFTDPSGGTPCTGAPSTWSGFGGTSISAPIMASFQALVNQNTGSSWGNPNPTYYSLAATEYGAAGNAACNSTLGNGVASTCIFYDVTQGDMDVPCTGTVNCYLPSGANGVLNTGPVGSAAVTAGGTGYVSAPTCTLAAPSNQAAYSTYTGGLQATCKATLSAGAVSAITITKRRRGLRRKSCVHTIGRRRIRCDMHGNNGRFDLVSASLRD